MRVLLVFLLVVTAVVTSDPSPYFPKDFASTVKYTGLREITYKFFYSSSTKKFRIDSYGVPFFKKNGQIFPSFMRNVQKSIRDEIEQKSDEALYVFIFRFDEGLLYNLFPNLEGFGCKLSKLMSYKSVPLIAESDFLLNATYKGQYDKDGTKYDHYASDFILFGFDYFQTTDKNPKPYQLIIGSDYFEFSDVGPVKESDFKLPPNTSKCTY
ncbi:atpD [Acrasis kona]|uniref:AtpD n=1 Tax=Acrasis kona TaxID=1008807 RepID=A0AAW2YSN2_9EUKA